MYEAEVQVAGYRLELASLGLYPLSFDRRLINWPRIGVRCALYCIYICYTVVWNSGRQLFRAKTSIFTDYYLLQPQLLLNRDPVHCTERCIVDGEEVEDCTYFFHLALRYIHSSNSLCRLIGLDTFFFHRWEHLFKWRIAGKQYWT